MKIKLLKLLKQINQEQIQEYKNNYNFNDFFTLVDNCLIL